MWSDNEQRGNNRSTRNEAAWDMEHGMQRTMSSNTCGAAWSME
jgi:hypothetical protein